MNKYMYSQGDDDFTDTASVLFLFWKHFNETYIFESQSVNHCDTSQSQASVSLGMWKREYSAYLRVC